MSDERRRPDGAGRGPRRGRLSAEVERGPRAGRPRRGARVDDPLPRPPVSREPRDAPGGGGGDTAARAPSRARRRRGRRAAGRASRRARPRPSRAPAGASGRRRRATWASSPRGGESGATTVAATMAIAAAAGIRVFATGRHRRSTPRRGGDVRRLGRPPRALAHARRRRRVGGEGGPRPPEDARGARDARRPGPRLRHLASSPRSGSAARGSRSRSAATTPRKWPGSSVAHWEWPCRGRRPRREPGPDGGGARARTAWTEAIERSLAAAREAGVTGKEVTPFLLARLAEETEGRSLDGEPRARRLERRRRGARSLRRSLPPRPAPLTPDPGGTRVPDGGPRDSRCWYS